MRQKPLQLHVRNLCQSWSESGTPASLPSLCSPRLLLLWPLEEFIMSSPGVIYFVHLKIWGLGSGTPEDRETRGTQLMYWENKPLKEGERDENSSKGSHGHQTRNPQPFPRPFQFLSSFCRLGGREVNEYMILKNSWKRIKQWLGGFLRSPGESEEEQQQGRESREMFIWKSDKEVIKLLLDVYQAGLRQV